MDHLCEKLYTKVIPRLLRPLDELKSISPVLVHGDLWGGNCCTDKTTGKPIAFDASAFWAHNEYELGTWRAIRYDFREYIEAYKERFPPSQPDGDFDDRNALYSIRSDLHSAISYSPSPKSVQCRNAAMETMNYLIEKYTKGYEGWEEEYKRAQDGNAAAATAVLETRD